MNLKTTNYRAVSQADISLNSIALVAGPNESGKSSLSQSLSACLTGDPAPIVGVTKAQAGCLVRNGAAGGRAELTGGKGITVIDWPSGRVSSNGNAPFASPFATGMQSIVNMRQDDKIKVMTEYLKGQPTVEDFENAVESMNLGPDQRQKIWERIKTTGWDGALKYYEGQRATMKGQWLEVTGEAYGSKKAESWLPDNWEHGLDGNSDETLAAVVTDCRDALEAALKTEAVDASKQDNLKLLANLLGDRKAFLDKMENGKPDVSALQAQLEECNGYIESIQENKKGLLAELAEMPENEKVTAQVTGMACPGCGAMLKVAGGKLEHAETHAVDTPTGNSAARAEIQSKIKAIEGAIFDHMTQKSKLESQIRQADTDHGVKLAEARRLVHESENSVKELADMAADPSETCSVDDCRTALSNAEKRLQAFRKKTTADARHRSICTMETLIDKLSPDGIRGDVLQRALKGFNEAMLQYSEAAGWGKVELGADFLPVYHGCVYLLLSESAKFRVRVVLQLAMAKIDSSHAVIIDAADILDKRGRSGLLKVVAASGLAALVCMTMNAREEVPNLAAHGLGSSYWIGEGGVVEGI